MEFRLAIKRITHTVLPLPVDPETTIVNVCRNIVYVIISNSCVNLINRRLIYHYTILKILQLFIELMDALLSMPWLYETLAEDRAAEEAAIPALEETKEHEAMQTGRL